MRIAGVICEFNPFHNGHAYLLKELRTRTNANAVVCAMSGCFVQRGMPACADKWRRAEMALYSGADLVLELPVTSAAQSAERFAAGGVSLLHTLGLVDFLGFGSECGDIDSLIQTANVMKTPAYRDAVSQALREGINYPSARQQALASVCGCSDLLSGANDSLALEYLRALSDCGAATKPIAIKRTTANHNAAAPEGSYASASYLRTLDDRNQAAHYMPEAAFTIYHNTPPLQLAAYETMLLYRLRTISRETLMTITDVTEGLENRILSAASTCGTLEELRMAVKSKRYTMTRIDRVLLNTLLGITKDLAVPPQYVRVLGFNTAGASVLREMKHTCPLPVIVKTADAALSGIGAEQFQKDLLATDLYSLLDGVKKGGRDFTMPPVINA